MYSYEDRKRFIELYFQYDESFTATKRELGYPKSHSSVANWISELESIGDIKKEYIRATKYTDQQRKDAVEYYLTHGKNVSRTCKKLGYPSRTLLTEWILNDVPAEQHNCRKGTPMIKSSQETKEKAVIEMCTSSESVKKIADQYGVSRAAVYDWKKRFLRKGVEHSVAKKNKIKDRNEKSVDELKAECGELSLKVSELKSQIYSLQLEKDVLEKAAEIIKKDQGVSLLTLTNKEKTQVIDALRYKYQLNELLKIFKMPKSSYCYNEKYKKVP